MKHLLKLLVSLTVALGIAACSDEQAATLTTDPANMCAALPYVGNWAGLASDGQGGTLSNLLSLKSDCTGLAEYCDYQFTFSASTTPNSVSSGVRIHLLGTNGNPGCLNQTGVYFAQIDTQTNAIEFNFGGMQGLYSPTEKSPTAAALFGYGPCDGTLGTFDVYVIQDKDNPASFSISVIPVKLETGPGDIVTITVANQSLQYRELVPQVSIFNDSEIKAGSLTEDKLSQFDILAITPFQAGVNFLEQNADRDAICTLPLPGDGVDNFSSRVR